jgi:hypothetical protein
MADLVQSKRVLLIGLCASFGIAGLLTGGEASVYRRALGVETTPFRPMKSTSVVSSPVSVPPPPKTAPAAVTPPVAPAPPNLDPFYDAARCPSLEVIRALETASGSDALVEVAAPQGPIRLRLGDDVDGRLLSYVGPHPKHGRLTVVFEGQTGACSADLRSTELALHRADREATLSAPVVPAGPDDALADQTSQFAVAVDDAPANAADFLPAEPESPR